MQSLYYQHGPLSLPATVLCSTDVCPQSLCLLNPGQYAV